ncbi:TetR/AcrR family transcriptional regulator C-terminal domain-containing protein [Streptomyces sp. NBC_00638]|uniref:TetR/AcrR family transcriptional regulator C-terminal domain-containing protein n=1 Tax=unclassified Streptomyces TaxID=2593676 RepID=UPI002259D9A6|nr:TetR/AcrR family transcriptional regulator C-terminal domain-containing protein [Streptomyces sp. NBC_00638]MCX5001370.1 TetR/AcrR family transcriptional regulator C-terminal domain-containing protein [Streptomyces sp. NBC_00638]
MTESVPSSVWTRPRPEPRRRAPGVDQYVAAALAIADAEGLAAVSMRRVAGDLGSGTATLYRYITNRDELVDLMVDAAQGEEPLPESAEDWRADLGAVAHALRTTLLRHPWLAGELTGRPALGPNSLRRSESALSAAVALTPDITLASQALGAVRAYVLGSVAAQQALLRAEQRTGLSKEEWQHSMGPYITEVLAAGQHPMLARRVHEAEELDPDVEFTFGLDCVLDGLAARLGR